MNLASATWIDAFDQLHELLSTYYAFTDWKQLDWASLYLEYQPRIAQASADVDVAAYYLTLREYTYQVPDAHLQLIATDDAAEDLEEDLRYQQTGGSFGFALIELDDGRFVAQYVAEESSAAQAGMVIGSEIMTFGGQPIDVALEAVPLVWSIAPPATLSTRNLQRGRFLGRAPVGVIADVSFVNPGSAEIVTATLTSIDDGYATLLNTSICGDLSPDLYSEVMDVDGEMIGYLRFAHTGDEVDDANLLIAQFAGAIEDFVDQEVIGVIVDIRTNIGGMDSVAAHLPGHFYSKEAHYEYVSFLNGDTGEFEVDPRYTLNTVPLTPYFGGPVVALTGLCTASSGEGVAMAIKRLRNGWVVGTYETYGSFGISGGLIFMPENLAVAFPPGRSLDGNLRIQIDSNADLDGGVTPELRVPLNDATIRSRFVDGDDVEMETAIDLILNRLSIPRRPDHRINTHGRGRPEPMIKLSVTTPS
jgi:carboxyl-terminal processing protease